MIVSRKGRRKKGKSRMEKGRKEKRRNWREIRRRGDGGQDTKVFSGCFNP